MRVPFLLSHCSKAKVLDHCRGPIYRALIYHTRKIFFMQNLPFQPQGFRSCAKNIGIRDQTLDFTVIVSDVPASAAAMFTQSRFCGPTIIVDREHVANGRLQTFVINSKNANVATGEQGMANVCETAQLIASELDIFPKMCSFHQRA